MDVKLQMYLFFTSRLDLMIWMGATPLHGPLEGVALATGTLIVNIKQLYCIFVLAVWVGVHRYKKTERNSTKKQRLKEEEPVYNTCLLLTLEKN